MHKSSEFSRTDRFNKVIAKHLAVIIRKHMDDPRFNFINITEVKVTADLAEAKVYFTALLDKDAPPEQGEALAKALNRAQKPLRYLLAQEVDLRRTPKLIFFYDTKLLEAMRISELLNRQQ